MEKLVPSDEDVRQWVSYHLVSLALIAGIALGVILIDRRIGEYVGAAVMPQFRAILLLSVLTAGLGARALLARNTATVDAQGWWFLILAGLLLLAVAAYGFADCYFEVREAYDRALKAAATALGT